MGFDEGQWCNEPPDEEEYEKWYKEQQAMSKDKAKEFFDRM